MHTKPPCWSWWSASTRAPSKNGKISMNRQRESNPDHLQSYSRELTRAGLLDCGCTGLFLLRLDPVQTWFSPHNTTESHNSNSSPVRCVHLRCTSVHSTLRRLKMTSSSSATPPRVRMEGLRVLEFTPNYADSDVDVDISSVSTDSTGNTPRLHRKSTEQPYSVCKWAPAEEELLFEMAPRVEHGDKNPFASLRVLLNAHPSRAGAEPFTLERVRYKVKALREPVHQRDGIELRKKKEKFMRRLPSDHPLLSRSNRPTKASFYADTSSAHAPAPVPASSALALPVQVVPDLAAAAPREPASLPSAPVSSACIATENAGPAVSAHVNVADSQPSAIQIYRAHAAPFVHQRPAADVSGIVSNGTLLPARTLGAIPVLLRDIDAGRAQFRETLDKMRQHQATSSACLIRGLDLVRMQVIADEMKMEEHYNALKRLVRGVGENGHKK
jgi:hypothetical protein